jgi:hypothetical protein
MNAYIYRADLYCEKCATAIKTEIDNAPMRPLTYMDSEHFPQGPYPNGGGEADSPQHCGRCGLFLENPLTTDGEQYVLDTFSAYAHFGRGNRDVLREWYFHYEYLSGRLAEDDLNILAAMAITQSIIRRHNG